MARKNLNITEEQLFNALKESTTQTKADEVLGCTKSYVSQLMKTFGIDAKVITETERDEKIEYPNYIYKQAKIITSALMKTQALKVKYYFFLLNHVPVTITIFRF